MEIAFKNLKSKILVIIALAIATVFCLETLARGYDFYTSIVSGDQTVEDVDISNYPSRFRIGSQYLVLTVIYLIWLVRDKQKYQGYDFLDILKSTWVFLAIAFIGYPFTQDIYLYLQYGLMAINGLNPYLSASGDFASVLSPFIFWNQTSTYGPISQIFFIISAAFVPVSPILGVYIFKFICLLFHLFNSYLIWREIRLNNYGIRIAIAYLLNPLLLFELVTEAHVDVFVCTTIILATTAIVKRKYVRGILAIWLGILSKTLPIILLPLFFTLLFKQKRWKILSSSIILSISIILALQYSILPSVESWKSLLNPGVGDLVSGSLHDLLKLIVNSEYVEYLFPNFAINYQDNILTAFRYLTYFCFAAYYAWVVGKAYWNKNYSESNLVVDMGWVTLVLLLFATPWLMPWYPTILFPFIALNLHARWFCVTSFTFGVVLSCAFYTLGYGPLYGQILPGVIGTVLATIPAIAILLFGRKIRQFPQFEKLLRSKGLLSYNRRIPN
ncbi:MAG TPA: hypothetical protein DCY88_18710 [Cyanobacteria bacterium UBA11372]|nr:hypothetical protein [Cyanobacteria bacterium UBA11372]